MFIFGLFLWADIARMALVRHPDTWIPSQMADTSSPPKITAFASTHDPALLYAELLRKYTSNELVLVKQVTPVWYEGQGASGYFCQHDGFLSFVAGGQDLTNDQTKLQKTLESFKAKYLATNFTRVTKEQKDALQDVVNSNSNSPNLLKATCEKASEFGLGITLYDTKCPILYSGSFPAAPHVHPYSFTQFSHAFKIGKTFIVCQLLFDTKANTNVLYRPHAYLAYVDNIEQRYPGKFSFKKDGLWKETSTSQENSWIQWYDLEVKVVFANNSEKILTLNDDKGTPHPLCIHNGEIESTKEKTAVASSEEHLVIDNFLTLKDRGPFFSHMTRPYEVTTLHIISDNEIPDSVEKLLIYFSTLPLDTQKFILRRLFPFLTIP